MGRKIKLIPNAFYLLYEDFREEFKKRIPEEFHSYSEEKFWKVKDGNKDFYWDVLLERETGLARGSISPKYFPGKISIQDKAPRKKKNVRLIDPVTQIEYVSLGRTYYYPYLFNFAGYKEENPFWEFIEAKLKASKLSKKEYELQRILMPDLFPALKVNKEIEKQDDRHERFDPITNNDKTPTKKTIDDPVIEFLQKLSRFIRSIIIGIAAVLSLPITIFLEYFDDEDEAKKVDAKRENQVKKSVHEAPKPKEFISPPPPKGFYLSKVEDIPDFEKTATEIVTEIASEGKSNPYVHLDNLGRMLGDFSKEKEINHRFGNISPANKAFKLQDEEYWTKAKQEHIETKENLLKGYFYSKLQISYYLKKVHNWDLGLAENLFYYNVEQEKLAFNLQIEKEHNTRIYEENYTEIMLTEFPRHISFLFPITLFPKEGPNFKPGIRYHVPFYYIHFSIHSTLKNIVAMENAIEEKSNLACIFYGKLEKAMIPDCNYTLKVNQIFFCNDTPEKNQPLDVIMYAKYGLISRYTTKDHFRENTND